MANGKSPDYQLNHKLVACAVVRVRGESRHHSIPTFVHRQGRVLFVVRPCKPPWGWVIILVYYSCVRFGLLAGPLGMS